MGHSLGRREVSRHAGFTLIEIMVVVVIIGIVAAAMVLSVGVTGRDTQVEKEGERAFALVAYAREQAELQTREFGLFCEESGYQFLKFDPRTGVWRPVEEDESLRQRKLPEGLRLQLVIEGRPVVLMRPARKANDDEEEELMPHVMLFSNGDLTPFQLTLVRDGGETRASIRSTDQGAIEVVPQEESR